MNHPGVRIGIGYDAHQFGPRRKLMLGGVRIPHVVGLEGHSDADVLLHAICDALLGAAGLGDIGKHFPDTSRRYRNISSVVLLQRVQALLKRHRYEVLNVDATVILERPKIQSRIPSMRKRIGAALKVPSSRVSIKATTNEGMGFVGRGEGCAALAVAAITATD